MASGSGDGLNWSASEGMTTLAGKLYASAAAGDLQRFDLIAGVPVPGSRTRVSGPRFDGQSWQSTAMFAL